MFLGHPILTYNGIHRLFQLDINYIIFLRELYFAIYRFRLAIGDFSLLSTWKISAVLLERYQILLKAKISFKNPIIYSTTTVFNLRKPMCNENIFSLLSYCTDEPRFIGKRMIVPYSTNPQLHKIYLTVWNHLNLLLLLFSNVYRL